MPRYDRLGASSRLRFFDPLPHLVAAGLDVSTAPFFDDDYLRRLYAGQPAKGWPLAGRYRRRIAALRAAGRTDLLWIEKEALPWLPAGAERLLFGGRPYVLDFDDAWHLRYAGHRLAPVRGLLGDKLERLVAGAALTVVANEALAAWAEGAGARRLLRLPTPVDLARYQAAPAPERTAAGFRVGWIGTPSSARYLAALAEPLAALAASGPLTLVTVASRPIARPGVPEEFIPWSETGEAEALAGIDVGIMPLPHTPFAQGKSGFKLLQYMAAGKAVVASPVGENRRIVADGVTGLWADSPEGWVQALEALRTDLDLRNRLAAAGRDLVAREYDLAVLGPRLAAALAQVARV
ncbi:glycosyltransferase involved in cell wall biosynthesis [Nitrospirillum amazonense]|uniref:Glycosyltransferase involved in cell wall biosynthesis n=1 Tax=Nitrospirillum amazonense TaxID=28077 RepID=A0A560KLM1_9PROT|nr:glycosyltransferase [Nitrospirillum amazonense]TWB82994.1 glycosyltransferase involved in cell wall biosynthesis [Nitrospirillum amazonense]